MFSRRMFAAIAIGALSAGIVTEYYRLHPEAVSDFDPLWVATRALLAGADPFAAVAALGWQWPLYYPLPALLVLVPFAVFPVGIARALFVGVSVSLLIFVSTRYRWWPLLVALSSPFLHAVVYAQWSPLLTIAVLAPIAGGLLVIKPSTGLALFLARPTWRAAAGGVAICLISFVVRTSWPAAWLEAIRQVSHLPAVRRPGGFLLLLALLRWRRPEARLLAALAIIPFRPVHYEMLPLLFLVPHTVRETILLIFGTELAFLFTRLLPSAPSVDAMETAWWPFILAFILIPSLVMVLRRPNRAARIGILEPVIEPDHGPQLTAPLSE